MPQPRKCVPTALLSPIEHWAAWSETTRHLAAWTNIFPGYQAAR